MKIVSIFLLALFSFFLLITPVVATSVPINTCPNTKPFDALCGIIPDSITTAIPAVLSILLALAVILAIIFLVWGGIKWILSGGDKAAVESARSMIVAEVVGLVLAFAA